MSRKRLVFLALAALVLPAIYWLPLILARSTAVPWSTPSISPDGQYEIRLFQCFSYSSFRFTTPGNGSDNVDGLIRLYDRKSGRLLREAFRPRLSSRESFWSKNEVYFLGDDGFIWSLKEP